jgi:surface protein
MKTIKSSGALSYETNSTNKRLKIISGDFSTLNINGLTFSGSNTIRNRVLKLTSEPMVSEQLIINNVVYNLDQPSNVFIMVWTGSSLTLPFTGVLPSYTVNWGDGTTTSTPDHTYSEYSTYTIAISNTPSFIFENQPSVLPNISTIPQIGLLGSCSSMFQNIQIPSQVQNDMANWNTSNVTNMSRMFFNCNNLSQSLTFNCNRVTNMSSMFSNCRNFNKTLNLTNTSNVTNMSFMFDGCFEFNQPLDTFYTSKATATNAMFRYCRKFNQPLTTFNTSNVTNMNAMFNECFEFNQAFPGSFITLKVTDMAFMFRGCSVFDNPLTTFNTSNVTTMNAMFEDCSKFNQPLNTFDTRKVTNMTNMFRNSNAMTDTNYLTLQNWNISNVTTMAGMFTNITSNLTMSTILAGWSYSTITNAVIIGVNVNQRAIGTTPASTGTIQQFYKSKNWSFRNSITGSIINIDSFFSAT